MTEAIFVPFAMFMGLMGALIGVVGLAVTIYAFYDILFQQPAMENLEKLIWVIVILVFNIFGVLAYFIVVKYMDENPIAEAISSNREHQKVNDLEQLADLKERGILTEDEFQKEKERILGARSDTVEQDDVDTGEEDQNE